MQLLLNAAAMLKLVCPSTRVEVLEGVVGRECEACEDRDGTMAKERHNCNLYWDN
jgi:hypothetical protein